MHAHARLRPGEDRPRNNHHDRVSVHLPSGRVLKHTADTRKPVETGYFGLFLSVF